jgi:hypothetical protein
MAHISDEICITFKHTVGEYLICIDVVAASHRIPIDNSSPGGGRPWSRAEACDIVHMPRSA